LPIYIFNCENCESQFEIKATMDSIVGLKPSCPECRKKNVYRDYSGTIVSIPKTLGSLAEKNASKMSEDHKTALTKGYNKYRDNVKLPDGMKHYKKDFEGNYISENNKNGKKSNANRTKTTRKKPRKG
jgi:putative FmdB family regulatory protein